MSFLRREKNKDHEKEKHFFRATSEIKALIFVALLAFICLGTVSCQTIQPGTAAFCNQQQSRCDWDCTDPSYDSPKAFDCWKRCKAQRNDCYRQLPEDQRKKYSPAVDRTQRMADNNRQTIYELN